MPSVTIRLSVMMFLQFFTWGAWFVTLERCLSEHGFENSAIGGAYQSAPVAAIFAPLFLGLLADRLFPSQLVQGVLMLLGAGLMAFAANAVQAGNASLAVWLFLAYMMCYMPTLGLGNSIAFTNIDDQNKFPAIRVWGTIGWIIAGLLVGGLAWSKSVNILWLAAGSSAVFGLYSFSLPHTPPPAKGKPLDIGSLLMVDAWRMLANVPFAVFVACSTLICIPLAYYYQQAPSVLEQTGFSQYAATMTIGQMSEIGFMLLVPLCFRRLGVKLMILIGMAAWVVRYALFAFGAADQVTWMLLLAVALHGVCYDFFFVTGFMYTDRKAPPAVRGQAQSLLVFFTQGVGMYFGFAFAASKVGETVTSKGAYGEALKAAREGNEPHFFESFGYMLSRSLPEGIDASLLAETMDQWKQYWLLPAYMAAAIFVVFLVTFFDRVSTSDDDDAEAPSPDAAS